MAVTTFYKGLTWWAYEILEDPEVTPKPFTDVSFWDDETGGNQIQNISYFDETAEQDMIGNVVATDRYGSIPTLHTPNVEPPILTMWAEMGQGPRVLLVSQDAVRMLRDRINDIQSQLDSIGSIGDLLELIDDVQNHMDEVSGELSVTSAYEVAQRSRRDAQLTVPRRGQVVFSGRNSANISVPSATTFPVPFDVVDVNVGVWNGLNPTEVNLVYPGSYKITFTGGFEASSSGTNRTAVLRHNGVVNMPSIRGVTRLITTGVIAVPRITPIIYESDGTDVIELALEHNVGSALNAAFNTFANSLTVTYLGQI